MGIRLTGISTPVGGVSWEYTKAEEHSAPLPLSPGQKIKVFISSICGVEKYDKVRAELKNAIERTQLVDKKIRNMGRFRTLKFECQLGTTEGYSFTDGTIFTIWISDDDNKIPLYIESPVKIGSINAYISGYKGLKYPVSSLMK